MKRKTLSAMKTLFATILAAACAAAAAPAAQAQHAGHKAGRATARKGRAAAPTRKAAAVLIKRGAPVGGAPAVAFADVLREPQRYAGRPVVVSGVVERVCKMEGCWMQIAPEPGAAESVRVTFDHKFTVPKDVDRMKFRAEGEFSVKTLSREEVEHLVKDDGAKIKTNPDGTAREVSFLATGVELWK